MIVEALFFFLVLWGRVGVGVTVDRGIGYFYLNKYKSGFLGSDFVVFFVMILRYFGVR